MDMIEALTTNLSKLPGIGKKSAQRMTYYLLRADSNYLNQLGDQLKLLKERVKCCSKCGNYTEVDPCPICSSAKRDGDIICVVEHPQDLITINSTGEYGGLFFVLNGVISPIDGIGPDDLRLALLKQRVINENIKEVILATNPTIEGDTTALYVYRMLNDTGVSITRLASGIPVGGDLEYADKQTIARSFKARSPISF
ncbi:recombination mediator RecR [Spirochaeta cellobiosiphila]|uniref:recombination mediator RecR n=1 Tax=Spirochaeta cellobiosiphila TaxID=504483 RepID=UPI00041124FD|nr:recombination mediator RecR [Spirochaeta cellobiosiphila]